MYEYKYLYKYNSFDPEKGHGGRYFTSQAPPIKEGTPSSPLRANAFYEHVNAQGKGYGDFFFLYTGEKMPYVGDIWNKRISALFIAPETRVTLYISRNYGNQYDFFVTATPYTAVNYSSKDYLWKDLTKVPLSSSPPLILGTWNDRTSSIKTLRQPGHL
jgi:hypothetical protein